MKIVALSPSRLLTKHTPIKMQSGFVTCTSVQGKPVKKWWQLDFSVVYPTNRKTPCISIVYFRRRLMTLRDQTVATLFLSICHRHASRSTHHASKTWGTFHGESLFHQLSGHISGLYLTLRPNSCWISLGAARRVRKSSG